MKKIIEKETTFCDKCEKETDLLYTCINCGKDLCFECRDNGVAYSHGVHFSGGGDGFYCKSCDTTLTTSGDNHLHNAYSEIQRLRDEERGWRARFKIKVERAESTVKELCDE